MNWIQAFAISGLLVSAEMTFAADEKPAAQRRPAQRGKPARLFAEYDKDGDGFLTKGELPERMLDRFEQMDADSDAKVSLEELRRFAGLGTRERPAASGPAPENEPLLRYLDTSGDGELSVEEIADATQRLGKLDKDGNGAVDRDEIPRSAGKGRNNGGKPGEIITPAAKGERIAEKLKVGDTAPEFTLPLLGGKGAISLATLRHKKPVVLIFASYT